MGWGEFFGAIGKLLGKLPIQGRRERWRNEIDNLTKERKELLEGNWNEKKGYRVIWIDKRINSLNQLLKNAESE